MSENILNIKVGEVKPEKTPEQKRDEFKEVIELYKVRNPVKFATKEKALNAKLEKLEAACRKPKKEADEPVPVSKPVGKAKVKKSK